MWLTRSTRPARPTRTAAFSLIEVMIAIAISGIMFLSLYTGFSSGLAIIQLARENLRATQILQEKMETIRLYTWDQITTTGFIPTNFTDVFYPVTQSSGGLIFTGTLSIASSPMTESYSNDLKQVTVTVSWLSSKIVRTRSMTTFVSRYGLQHYVY